jgi:hypothetical protein
VKKFLVIVLSVLFILSFTVTAFAIHEETSPEEAVVAKGPAKITLGGKIIVRGWYFHDVDANGLPAVPNGFPVDEGGSGTGNKSEALYTTNAYFTVNAKISDNIQGFMELETSNAGSNNSGVAYWGQYDSKLNADLRFRQLWLQYTGSGLLGIPAGIKAGHMPITLGEKQFLNNERFGDDAILLWIDPTKEMHLVLGTTKLVESSSLSIGNINHAQDLNGYVLIATYMLDKDNTIGVNWTWAHSDANIPSLASEGFPVVDTVNFHNVGVHGHGNVSGLSYAAEADFQFGKARPGDDTLLTEEIKFSGWAVFAKLGYMLDPVNIRAAFAMGSGDNGDDPGKVKEFQTLQGTDATGAIARLPHYTLIYERLVRTAATESLLTTYDGGNTRTTGIANTTYYNLGFDVNPMKELGITLDGYYIRATKTGAFENVANPDASVSKNVGFEVDGKINYKIAKNLSYFVEAGMFFPGKFYSEAFADSEGNPLQKKTVTMAVHGLILEF